MKDLLLGVRVVVKISNVEISRCRSGGIRQRILLKCVPHVQDDYFSAFNQSDHCFLGLSLPLPSSLLKLSTPKGDINSFATLILSQENNPNTNVNLQETSRW